MQIKSTLYFDIHFNNTMFCNKGFRNMGKTILDLILTKRFAKNLTKMKNLEARILIIS